MSSFALSGIQLKCLLEATLSTVKVWGGSLLKVVDSNRSKGGRICRESSQRSHEVGMSSLAMCSCKILVMSGMLQLTGQQTYLPLATPPGRTSTRLAPSHLRGPSSHREQSRCFRGALYLPQVVLPAPGTNQPPRSPLARPTMWYQSQALTLAQSQPLLWRTLALLHGYTLDQ
jgi:hypothetical protein